MLSDIWRESQVEQPKPDATDDKLTLNQDLAFDRFESIEAKSNNAENKNGCSPKADDTASFLKN